MFIKYTGYKDANSLLDELEELKNSATLRANDLNRSELERAKARSAADAYAFCQLRLMHYF